MLWSVFETIMYCTDKLNLVFYQYQPTFSTICYCLQVNQSFLLIVIEKKNIRIFIYKIYYILISIYFIIFN